MSENLIRIVGLCQVNDIIPIIYSANDILEQNEEPEKLVEIHDEEDEAVSMPSVLEMEKFIQKKGVRKKGFEVNNMKRYLLLSSLHNRGMGCRGTSPLIVPLAVYLVEEDGSKLGGIYCNLKKAYAKLRKLVEMHFTGDEDRDSLIVITPELNKKILKKQLRPGKIPLKLKMEEMVGECISTTDSI
jgi:hypothetical protein